MTITTVRRTASKPLTERALLTLKPGQKRADGALPPGFGRLIVRAQGRGGSSPDSVIRQFFFRYRDADGKDRTLLLGVHGSGSGMIDLAEARRKAHAFRDQMQAGLDPQARRAHDRLENRRMEQEAAQTGTLADLVNAYVDQLREKGKESATDTERTMRLHVTKPFPVLAATNAKDITPSDISDVMAQMIGKGIQRRTNIARSMLSAAFAFGAALDNDPRRKARALQAGGTEAKRFGIVSNPVTLVPPIQDYEKAGERTLTDDELKAYWLAIDKLSPGIGACLKVALLLGGQRLSQIKRLTRTGYNADDRTVELLDGKGRGAARVHLLPVSGQVIEQLQTMEQLNAKEYLFSTTNGQKEIDLTTLSVLVSTIAQAYAKERQKKHPDQPAIVPYTARDIRRSVETRMAALGISKEIRAQVLSHGRQSGVQAKHYDKYSYLPEKTAALAKWEAHLQEVFSGAAPKVIRGAFRTHIKTEAAS